MISHIELEKFDDVTPQQSTQAVLLREPDEVTPLQPSLVAVQPTQAVSQPATGHAEIGSRRVRI